MKRALLGIEAALLAIAAASLGYGTWVWASARAVQGEAFASLNDAQPSPRHDVVTEGSLLGEIEIPRIGLSSAILEGTDDSTLRRAAGHIPGTPAPGKPGNLCVAGHRDTFFRPLRRIAVGDKVVIRTPEARITYRVESTKIVEPDDVQVLDSTPTDAVTLVTCYPFHFIGPAPKRFVVRAVRIQEPS